MDNLPCREEFSFYMPDMMRTNKLGKTAVYLRWNIDGEAHENANVYIYHFFLGLKIQSTVTGVVMDLYIKYTVTLEKVPTTECKYNATEKIRFLLH